MGPEQLSTGRRIAKLRGEIAAAFGGARAPAIDRIALHQCSECATLRAAFAGKDWHTLDRAFLDRFFSKLPLLSPEAMSYYLPAYLLCSLDDFTPDNIVAEFTVYHLAPDEPTSDRDRAWWRQKLRYLTADQMAVLADFMQLVGEDEAFRTYLGDVGPKHLLFRRLWEERWD